MQRFIDNLAEKVLSGKDISFDEAKDLLKTSEGDLPYLFQWANRIKTHFRLNKVDLCSITNAKSGDCSENCSFCSQSSHHNTNIATYPLISKDEIIERAMRAAGFGAHRFCIVTSGKGIETEDELNQICDAIKQIKSEMPDLRMDASLGCIDFATAKRLKDAGLDRFNHNIETTEDFFSNICTTHTFQDRLKTISILKEAGLEVCCGGIFGLGESGLERVKFAFTLKKLDVDCVPLNFLNSIPGTPLANNPPIEPSDILKIIAIFRFVLSKKQIRICGGRQKNLGDMQSKIFSAGADAIILGDYLTTKGSPPDEDIKMLTELKLDFSRENLS